MLQSTTLPSVRCKLYLTTPALTGWRCSMRAARCLEPRVLLPEELVQMVYTVGCKHQVLDLQDRLRGLAVCRTWLGALSDLPFPNITLYCQDDGDYWDNWKNHYDVGKVCQWIIMKQPTVTELYQQSPLELSDHAIHSLQRKGLLKLTWGCTALDIARTLPLPAMFPNLQHLDAQRYVETTDWLAGLGALSNLESLKLKILPKWQDPAPAPVQLPPLARLTSLWLKMYASYGQRASAQLALADLPALAELKLKGSSSAAVLTSGPAPRLQHLTCCVGQLSADLAALLPGLKSAGFKPGMQLDQAAGLASATGLTRLELLKCHGGTQSSARELLLSLPPSVRCLHLGGEWSMETAALAGELPGLVALSMKVGRSKCRASGMQAPLPPVGAPLWTRLRAFSWQAEPENDAMCDMMGYAIKSNLPKVLQQASRLETLQANLVAPSVLDLDLIASLPALRKVNFPLDRRESDGEQFTAGRRLLQRALPHVALQERTDLRRPVKFLKWALD